MAEGRKISFEVVKLLGAGSFGKVFLIEDVNNPDTRYALKLMNLIGMGPAELDMLVQEIELLSTLDHKHVLKYITCFTQDVRVCIITEFCSNGDLANYVESRRGTKLEEDRLIEWFRQIASAVEYLHQNDIIHRDLKLQNVFLNDEMDCVLGDLGVARKMDADIGFAQTVVGTAQYMSPEIFLGIPYNEKTDIWSLGVMMYELAALEKPFNAFTLPLLIHKVTMGETPEMPGGYCDDFKDLLAAMLQKVYFERPSSAQILQHRLFKREIRPEPLERFKTGVIQKEVIKDKNIASFVNTFVKMRQLAKRAKMRVQKRHLDNLQESAEADPSLRPEGGASGEKKGVGVDVPIKEMKTKTMTLKEMHEFDKTETKLMAGQTGYLTDQVQQFKMYCLKVIDNDEVLFKEASMALNKSGNNTDIEKKLTDVLGKEKFDKCGVQLLYYKNYGHNLNKK